jgi:hypothetical protein
MYLGFYPRFEDWVILVLMGILQSINSMYKDKKTIEELEKKVFDKYEEKNSKKTYYFARVWKIINGITSFCILIVLIVMIFNIQNNLINWIYFCQTIFLVSLKLRASTSVNALGESLMVARNIKYYSLMVFISNIVFISFVGYDERDNV